MYVKNNRLKLKCNIYNDKKGRLQDFAHTQ